MKSVVYAFGVEDGVVPVTGAAPPLVLARQLPRLIVHALNGGGDRGARFFPLMGRDGQRRRFFAVAELLPDETALRLHGQEDVHGVTLGLLRQEALRLRVLTAEGGVRLDAELAFDPVAPLAAVARAAFEISGALGARGASYRSLDLAGEALTDYLLAADTLLALEADLLGVAPAPALDGAVRALAARPGSAEARQLVLQLAARAAAAHLQQAEVAALIAAATALVDDAGFPFLQSCAALLEACGGDALPLHERLLRIDPAHAASASRLAAAALAADDLKRGRATLERAVAAGCDEPVLLAQLAALQFRDGDPAARVATMERLLLGPIARAEHPAVDRIAAGYLIDGERWLEAGQVLDRALGRHPRESGLWFERARLQLALADGDSARAALQSCLQANPTPPLRADAERLLRFCEHPRALAEIVALDRALKEGAVDEALRIARRLTRSAPRLGEAWLCLGAVRQRLQHHWRARRALWRAVALEDGLGEAHNRLGILLVDCGRARPGLQHLQRAAELMPGESSVQVHLAQAHAALGDVDGAHAALAHAERLGESPATLARLRSAFFGGGQ